MERAAWTDERLDDLSRRMDAGFARVDADIRGLRTDMRTEISALRRELRGEMSGMGSDLRGEIGILGSDLRGEMSTMGSELRGAIDALRLTMLRVGGGIMVGLVGVIGAVLVSA